MQERWKQLILIIFFQAGTVTNSTIWLVLSAIRIFLSLTTVTVTLAWVFFREFFLLRAWKKINKLFTGLESVRIAKNCGLRLENTFSRPRSQFWLYGPSSRQITYIYWTDKLEWVPCQLTNPMFGRYFSVSKRPWQTGYMESWRGPSQYLSPAPRLVLLMQTPLQEEGKATADYWQSVPRLRD